MTASSDRVADPPAHHQAGQRHDDDDQQVVGDVADGAADEHRRPRHRQRPEPVDDALLHVVGEPRAGERGAEGDGLGEDPRDEELLVVAALHVDRPTEDVGEQQHEHDRLQRREDQQVGHPLDLDEVALGDDQAVAHRRQRAHRATTLSSSLSGWASAAWPVRLRNTSSRVGRRRPTSDTATPAASSRRSASTQALRAVLHRHADPVGVLVGREVARGHAGQQLTRLAPAGPARPRPPRAAHRRSAA